jgi:N-acetylglutamate synthase-like GNAT family acetyltransferase
MPSKSLIKGTNMKIRKATDQDCYAIYELRIASIKHSCANFYPGESIAAWIESKSPADYKNIPKYKTLIVVEENTQVVGFGLLNVQKKIIESLYLAPNYAGKGYGKTLLNNLEEIAKKHGIKELTVFSTLNANKFYRSMGYHENIKTTHELTSGIQLDCIKMTKKIYLNLSPLNKLQ